MVLISRMSINFGKKHLVFGITFICITLAILSFLWKPDAPVSKALMSPIFLNVSKNILKEYGSNPKGIPLLLLFTTFSTSLSKSHIHENTIRNWALLRPAVQPLMFYDKDLSSQWKVTLKKLGWALMPVPKYNSFGIPIFHSLFETAIENFPAHYYGYSNGDILYDESLVLTLQSVYKQSSIEDFLLIGRRINYLIPQGQFIHSLADMRQYSQREEAKLFIKQAQDYFITTKHSFTWEEVPDFVIGRVGYDNWLVSLAMRKGPLVIDATKTVLCLHQTGTDGEFAGRDAQHESNYNLKLAGDKFDYSLGTTDCAAWVTEFSGKATNVIVKKREYNYCYGHRSEYFEHQDLDISPD